MTLAQTVSASFVHACFGFFGRWFPEKTAKFALGQMLKPPPFRFKQQDLELLSTGDFLKVFCRNSDIGFEVSTWSWNKSENSRRILLVHGWAGASVQFRNFVQPLIDQGFNVTLMDLPAHGRSPGKTAHLPGSGRVVRDVIHHFNDVYAVIGHSFGAAAASLAINWGARVSKVVLFAPMSDVNYSLGKIVRSYGASPTVFHMLRARAEEKFNFSWEDISPASFSNQLNTPALIIHDKDDRDIELDQSYRLQMMWPQSQLLVSEGLGHYRILKNKDLINKAIEFIKN